jgi:hypothetical protein
MWCLNECDREASIMRRLWPTRGFWAMKESKISVTSCMIFLIVATSDTYLWSDEKICFIIRIEYKYQH